MGPMGAEAESPARLREHKGSRFKRELRLGESRTDAGSARPQNFALFDSRSQP